MKYSLDLRKCKDRNCCKQPRAPEIYDLLSTNNSFLPPIIQGRDDHFLSLIYTLEYFREKLPGYDEHCPSITPDLYYDLICQKCLKYFLSKTFLKQHTKIIHLKERVAKIIEIHNNLSRDDGYDIEHNYDIRNNDSLKQLF